ncbi:hypothetical protein DFJ58DRAFT_714312 [Suillus subalutaceus]|uniref:uncharacterized protein n=1 Tax=Suillus subalutaceus TaxID=48586 RepID=UPI001B8761C2|nr:uncharacterized protein DFJ58DRAFT_714312 [Suillus subalutaceus]KAG1867828.1 hypothetical protein DFJ58DRAFT_714312 [Suillus subalutaceus]
MSGKKRASPGADVEKNPLANVELNDEDAQKLQNIQKDIQRVELVIERQAMEKLNPVYEKRRAVAKSIEKFWPVALMNNTMISFHAQHTIDQLALSYLEDLWIVRDPKEPRCYTIEFYFKANPYFTDSVLKKEYKYVPPPAASDDNPDEDGITDSMLEFSWARDVQPSATPIHWKDPENALTKLHPRVAEEAGSFFNFFEIADDPFEVNSVDYFMGNVAGDELDSEEEDSEDDDDDAEEIDLEKPRAKKQKKE